MPSQVVLVNCSAGGPTLTIFVCTIPTESGPSLGFLQGWAMRRVQFDFVVDTYSKPLDAGIFDSRPSQKTRRTGHPLCGDVSKIKAGTALPRTSSTTNT